MTDEKKKPKKKYRDDFDATKDELGEERPSAQREQRENEQRIYRTARSAPPPDFYKARDKFREILDEEVKPKASDFSVITLFTKELVKHGDYSIRFVEELDEPEPTLLVSVNLPRGVLPGDPEVFALHEIAQRITQKTDINLIVTTTGVGGGGKRVDYSPGKVARAVGRNLLADMPNLYACERQLRMAFTELEMDENYCDPVDILNNLNVLSRIYFHIGLKEQALLVVDQIEKVLAQLLRDVETNSLSYTVVYSEFNEAAVLCAIIGDYDRAFQLIDKNFQQLAEYVEKHNVAMRREDHTDHEAQRIYGQLPGDLTFSRQEMREKVFFYKEKLDSIVSDCTSTLDTALVPVERFKEN